MPDRRHFGTESIVQLSWLTLFLGLAGVLILPVIAATGSGEFKIGVGADPATASDGNSFSIVVWQADDGDSTGISGLFLDQAGNPLGSEFQVNSSAAGTQRNPDVAVLPDGEVVVVWENEDASGTTVVGRRFFDTGLPAGAEFLVQPNGRAVAPAIGADAEGNFVVAWAGSASAGGNGKYRHFSRRFERDATPLEPPRGLGRKGRPTPPSVAVRGTGEYLVTWESGNSIYAVTFDRFGSQIGSMFRVNEPGGKHSMPAAGVTSEGDFTLTWRREKAGEGATIRVRGVTDPGIPSGIEYQVNRSSVDAAAHPMIASDDADNTVVVWQSEADASGRNSVFTRLIDRGIPSGIEYEINPTSTGLAGNVDVTPEFSNSFLVVWENHPPTAAPVEMDILANCFEVIPD